MKGQKQLQLLNCKVFNTEIKAQSYIKQILSYLTNQESKRHSNRTSIFTFAEKKVLKKSLVFIPACIPFTLRKYQVYVDDHF